MRLMKKKKSPAMAIWFMVAWPKGNILGAETAVGYHRFVPHSVVWLDWPCCCLSECLGMHPVT